MADTDLPRRIIRLRNQLEELDRLHPFVAQFCQACTLPAEESFALSLALDELVTNVILHGYTDSAAHEIEVALSRVGEDVIVEMEDDAPAFDPSEGGVIDLSGDPEERQIGGLGLHFVRRAIDEMIYRRIDGRNRLLMKKRVAAKRE